MAKELKKALNAYLYNVEYGYVYDRECNTNWRGAAKPDEWWTEKENMEKVRTQENLLPIKQLDKDRKESLKKKLLATEKMKKYDRTYSDAGNIIKGIAEKIDDITYAKINIPYYCKNKNKYSKVGTYEAKVVNYGDLKEILYVTQFEEKLYDLEQILRKKIQWGKPTDYEYTTTLYFTYMTYGKKDFLIANGEILYGDFLRKRKDWVDDVEQQSKRNKFYEAMEEKNNYVPWRRWKNTIGDSLMRKKRQIYKELDGIKIKNNSLIKAFHKEAKAAGWEIDEGEIYWGRKEKSREELEKMTTFVNTFNLDTLKMDVNIKDLLGRNVIRYTYDKIVKNVDLKWIKAHQKWVNERANKFVGPMTVKVKTDGTIEFFGGTLIMARTCKACDGWYGKEYTFAEPLDIKSYKIGDHYVLKNLIPENLLEKAVVRRIYVSQDRGERKLKYKNPNPDDWSYDDEHETTLPEKPDPDKYRPLKL